MVFTQMSCNTIIAQKKRSFDLLDDAHPLILARDIVLEESEAFPSRSRLAGASVYIGDDDTRALRHETPGDREPQSTRASQTSATLELKPCIANL